MPASARLAFVVAFALISRSAGAADISIDGRKFTLPDGFTIARVAGPPLVDRPIVADFDEQGRLYVADSSGSNDPVEKQLEEKPHRIVQLEDTDADGTFDKQTVFADRMMFPEGTMWRDGSLYVAAPPSIWRLSDTDGDGVADDRVEWFQGKTLTRCANDLHGPYLGPDGLIYWCKGAFAQQTYERPAGQMPFVTRASHIFRSRPDNSNIEPVMTGGMDNPVDVVFMPGGERILSTTFFQHPAGGRRDGLIHAIYGGVYGRPNDALNGHPRSSSELMPVLSHLGPAAACGLTRYESDVFGPDYRDNLFTCLFNMHKLTRHVLEPNGSTFKSRDSDFLVCDDLDFHPTDVLEDADGSLLVIDTGGWYKLCCPTSQLQKPDVLGAIYRIRREGAPRAQDPRGLKLPWRQLGADGVVALLDDSRPAVRNRAVRELGQMGEPAVRAIEQVWSASTPATRLAAVWAATQIDVPAARALVRRALSEDDDETVRQAAAHSASVWRDPEALAPLLRLLAEASLHNRRVAAEALGRIGYMRGVPELLDALAGDTDRVLDHSLTFALIEIADPKATAAGLSHEHPKVQRGAMIALDQMEGGGLDAATIVESLGSSDADLRDAAGWIAGRHPEWGEAVAGAIAARMRQWPELSNDERASLQQQLAGLSRSPAIQKLLVQRLSDPASSDAERQIALTAMAESRLGTKEIPAEWIRAISAVLADRDDARVADAVGVIRRLPLGNQWPADLTSRLLDIARRDDLPATVRLEALTAIRGGLMSLDPRLFAFVIDRLDPNQPAAERMLGAEVIGRSRLTPDQLAELTAKIRIAGPLEISQLLAPFEKSSDDEVGFKLIAALQESRATRSLRPDMLKARLKAFSPAVQKQAEGLFARLNPDADAQRARLEQVLLSMPPGDIRRGQALFNSQTTACASCHAIGYLGGKLGPDLTRIGAVRAERDLVESILFPSASLVQSFEPVMVQTKRGERHAGVLRRNDDNEVVLATGPEQEVRIPRDEVKELRPGTVSVMPAGLDEHLKPQELADLIAFLKACK